MRGADGYNESPFTRVTLEGFVPPDHPLRPIRQWGNEALAKMDERFSAMYETDINGVRPSIAPEKLMRAMLQQVLYRPAQRMTARRADQQQITVPLIRGLVHRRQRVEPLGVQQEPRPTDRARRGDRAVQFDRGDGSGELDPLEAAPHVKR